MAQVKIIGRVVESINESEGVPFVNCKITPNPGTVGFATGVNGNIDASINLDFSTTYSFEFSSIGYTSKIIQKQISSPTLDLGTIKLSESTTVLNEFEVVAEPTTYEFRGIVLDETTNQPISEADIIPPSPANKVKSQIDGSFLINLDLNSFTENIVETTPNKDDIQVYTVVEGDTLYKIARKFPINEIGLASRVNEIYEANLSLLQGRSTVNTQGNTLANEDLIFPGDKLSIAGYYNSSQTNFKNFNFIITAKDYNQKTIPATRGNQTLIDNLGRILLTPIKKDVDQEIVKQNLLTKDQEKIIKEDTKKDFISAILKRILQIINDKLIPLLISKIAAFGITKLNEEILNNINKVPKTCPPTIKALNDVIDAKNKLTKQLNNFYNSINLINKFLQIPIIAIDSASILARLTKISVNVASFIPSTAVTPIPVGPILIAKDLIKDLEDKIGFLKNKGKAGGIQLRFIVSKLNQVIQLLSVLDTLIGECAEELGTTLSEQEQISQELLKSTQEQSQQLSPVVINVNGFDMAVISIDNVTIGGLKRRQAIAKNPSGVIMLRGEPSFSSNDQVLIDELVFYIQQNDLKAD
jgi:LysM repeat protein